MLITSKKYLHGNTEVSVLLHNWGLEAGQVDI